MQCRARSRNPNAPDARRGVTVERPLDAQIGCSVDVLVDAGEGELELRCPVGDGHRRPDLRPPPGWRMMLRRPISVAVAGRVGARLEVIAHPARIRLVDALDRGGEVSVGDLAGEVEVSVYDASRHLALLRRAGWGRRGARVGCAATGLRTAACWPSISRSRTGCVTRSAGPAPSSPTRTKSRSRTPAGALGRAAENRGVPGSSPGLAIRKDACIWAVFERRVGPADAALQGLICARSPFQVQNLRVVEGLSGHLALLAAAVERPDAAFCWHRRAAP